jgi:hypothetical protein
MRWSPRSDAASRWHIVIYVALIIFFAFFYTAIVFNPQETADNLRENAGFMPGIRPGARTAEYIDYVLTRITDQLHDDGRGDVRHDVEGEDRHPLDGTPREHVEHTEDARGQRLEAFRECRGIDAGDRDVGAEPIDDERGKREPQTSWRWGWGRPRLGRR